MQFLSRLIVFFNFIFNFKGTVESMLSLEPSNIDANSEEKFENLLNSPKNKSLILGNNKTNSMEIVIQYLENVIESLRNVNPEGGSNFSDLNNGDKIMSKNADLSKSKIFGKSELFLKCVQCTVHPFHVQNQLIVKNKSH